jgi:hypothetical protein
VVDDGTGNIVWRASNAFTAGSFADQPFAPRPGGEAFNPAVDAVNGNPDEFSGESSTGATFDQFYTEFLFRSATGGAQTGASLTFSPDNGLGARQGFVDIEDTGTGIDILTFDVNPADGTFVGPTTIATGLNYTDYHSVGIEILFNDTTANDVINYYVNGALVHTGTSWEEFYRQDAGQAALHPNGVPVQTLLARISGTAVPTTEGGGFYVDNVLIAEQRPVSPV